MPYTAEQLDRIVNMVVERLRRMPSETERPAGAAPRKLATIHEVERGKIDTSTLALSEKVVTAAALADRLTGVTRVLVAQGSIVTPSARDELRARKIHLQYGASPVRSAGSPLVIGSDQKQIAASAAAGSLAAHVLPHDNCWKNLLDTVAREISGSRKLGVLISGHAAAAACTANRNAQLRAIVGSAAEGVVSDKRQIGANLLVIDPHGRGLFQVSRIVAAFARDGYLDPPRGLNL